MAWTKKQQQFCISIRAPLAGSDSDEFEAMRAIWISIRAPLAGSDRYIL